MSVYFPPLESLVTCEYAVMLTSNRGESYSFSSAGIQWFEVKKETRLDDSIVTIVTSLAILTCE